MTVTCSARMCEELVKATEINKPGPCIELGPVYMIHRNIRPRMRAAILFQVNK